MEIAKFHGFMAFNKKIGIRNFNFLILGIKAT